MTSLSTDSVNDNEDQTTKKVYQLLQSLTPGQRCLKALQLSDTVRSLIASGIMHSHPLLSEQELREEFARRTLPDDLATRFIQSLREARQEP